MYVYSCPPELILHLEIKSKYIGPVLELKFIDFSLFKRLIKSKILSLNMVLEKALFTERIAIGHVQFWYLYKQTANFVSNF